MTKLTLETGLSAEWHEMFNPKSAVTSKTIHHEKLRTGTVQVVKYGDKIYTSRFFVPISWTIQLKKVFLDMSLNLRYSAGDVLQILRLNGARRISQQIRQNRQDPQVCIITFLEYDPSE